MQNFYTKILQFFSRFRKKEEVYSRFKLIYKPDDYILDISSKNISPFVTDNEATFIYKGKVKSSVEVVGEFNNWRPSTFLLKKLRNHDIYHVTIELPSNARLEYKYIKDNEWCFDPLNHDKCHNGIGGENSYFTMPKYQRAWESQKRKNQKYGNVQIFELAGFVIPGTRRIYVYTPPGYDETGINYPVMYIQDGQGYLETARIDNIADNLINDKKIQPVIMVMINPLDRESEYIMNPHYSDLVVHEIIPRVDKRFRTIKSPAGRCIAGASLGGLISTYIGLTNPASFSKVGGQSSAFTHVQTLVEELMETHADKHISFYLDVGIFEDTLITGNERIVKLLEKKSCKYSFQIVNQGHTWTSWSDHFKDLLLYFWGNNGFDSGN